MTSIEYLSANPGAGKTRALILDAQDKALNGDIVIVAMRSKDSISEVREKYFSKKSPFYDVSTIISGDESGELVISRIVTALKTRKTARMMGRILIITHKALFMLPYKKLLSGKHLLIDEIPSPVGDWEFSAGARIPLFNVLEEHGDDATGLLRLIPRNGCGKKLREIAASGEDAATRDVAWSILHFWFDTFISRLDFEKLSSASADEKIHVFSRLRFEPFSICKSVVVGGAHFENSLFCLYGQNQNIKFEQRLDLHKRLQFTVPDTGLYTAIGYAHCGDWSKSLRDKPIDENSNVLQHVAGHVADFFGDRAFLYSVNKGAERDDLFQSPNAVRLPHVSHGLNRYSHIDNVAFLSATNPTPWMSGFHTANGLSSSQVKQAIYFENVAQAVYRTSIRVPGSTSPKTIIVMDKASAYWLQAELPGATVFDMSLIPENIGIRQKPGRPRVHENAADRTFASRENAKNRLKKAELIDSILQLGSTQVAAKASTIAKAMDPMECNEIDIDSYKYIVTEFHGMQFHTKVATVPSRFILCEDSDQFVESLRSCHEQEWQDKSKLELISPSFFNRDKVVDTDRGLENIEFSRGVFLDNDGGALSSAEFASLFPNIRIVVWNTASSSATLVKWRAYIPTTGAISRQAYEFIVEQMFSVIAGAGFHSKKSKIEPCDGFDTTKKGPASLFYVPCQARNSDDSFFVDFNGEMRRDLDVSNWIEQFFEEADGQEDSIENLHTRLAGERDEASIESARQYWRFQTAKGDGNIEFLNLGLKLATAGASEREIRGILSEESTLARSTTSVVKRRRQIPTIIRTLRIWGHLPG